MARIPENEIERLKSEVSVQRLIEAAGIELKKSGEDQQRGGNQGAGAQAGAGLLPHSEGEETV